MGGNAFLRWFSSSVAAGALILPQVARAQGRVIIQLGYTTSRGVKFGEGCGSCEDPNLRFVTVMSSSQNVTTIKYTNCAREPFCSEPLCSKDVTLQDINSDITTLHTLNQCVNTNDASVVHVSFPCMTSSSRGVFFDDSLLNPEEENIFPSLEKISFANLKTLGRFRISNMPALISISAPLLEEVTTANGLEIFDNTNLEKISLLSLKTVSGAFLVQGNSKLKKLCASNLIGVDFSAFIEGVAGTVCIGNDQPFLDADLSKLVVGNLAGLDDCYQNRNAPTVCGKKREEGLFSRDGCPSKASPKKKKKKKKKKAKKNKNP